VCTYQRISNKELQRNINRKKSLETFEEDLDKKNTTSDELRTEILDKRTYLEEMKSKKDRLIKEKKQTNKNQHSIFEQLSFLKNLMKNFEDENSFHDFLDCFKKFENCFKVSDKNKESAVMKYKESNSQNDIVIAYNACNLAANFVVSSIEKNLDMKNEQLDAVEKSIESSEKNVRIKQEEYILKQKEMQTFQEKIQKVSFTYLHTADKFI
jgi:hypothetical protein